MKKKRGIKLWEGRRTPQGNRMQLLLKFYITLLVAFRGGAVDATDVEPQYLPNIFSTTVLSVIGDPYVSLYSSKCRTKSVKKRTTD
jgi:hypothetical protein